MDLGNPRMRERCFRGLSFQNPKCKVQCEQGPEIGLLSSLRTCWRPTGRTSAAAIAATIHRAPTAGQALC